MSPRVAAMCLLLAAAGCHGCREDHPYVPYAIGSSEHERERGDAGEGVAPTTSGEPLAPDAGGPAPAEPAVMAPPATARWTVGALVLDAPPGLFFVSGVVRDFDGDGAPDAFAVVRPSEGGDPGQLAFYRGTPGAPSTAPLEPQGTFAPPQALAREATCAPNARLFGVGARSVLVELGVVCPPRTTTPPDRWVALVSGGTAARMRLAATIVDPPGAPALSVEADLSDRDGDGREDVALRVTLEGGSAPLEPGPRVTALVAWLDRPAGWSRDASATESSFASLASQAMARARSPREAPSVPSLVQQTRALWRAVCADGGAPRLVGVAGTGTITCGSTRALEDAGLAEVKSYVTTGDALRAALALDRARVSPGTARPPAKLAEARAWVESIAPAATSHAVRAIAAVPQSGKGHEPAWGPLAFEASGKLLVRTRAGVVRVDPEAGDEASADDVTAWPSAVVSPDASLRWIETYDACDGVALHATFASGDDVRDVALPVPPPLGDRCAGSRGAPARAFPVAWGPGGLEAVVEGEPVLITPESNRASFLAAPLDSPTRLGAPRSPDGKTLVVATSVGLLVRGTGKPRLLRAAELEGTWSEQRDCVVSNDAARAACVHAGKAWVGTWDVP
jgi:hypothetical protein